MTAGIPDVTPFVDLTIYDRSAQDLVDEFLAAAALKFPDWTPREGNTEVEIAEAYAQLISEFIFALNRLPGAVLEALLRTMFDLPRDTGAPVGGSVSVLAGDALGHVLLAGTRFALPATSGSTPIVLTTLTDLAIDAGSSSGVVDVAADLVGAAANGTPAGTTLQTLDAVAWIDEATLSNALSGGRDPEAGPAYLARGAALFARLTQALAVDDQYTAAALAVAGVSRAFTLDRFDPGPPVVDPSNGHVTVVLADVAGGAVNAGVKAAVTAALVPDMVAGLVLHLADPTVTPVDVDVTVHRDASASDATIVAAVTAALGAYLSPASWPFAGTVFAEELRYVIRGVPGVDRVEALTTPAADVALPGVGPLPTAGVISVTVHSG